MMDQEYWKIIANRILSLRAKRGFSTYKLESMSGVDASTIESIEKGQSKNPTIQTLHKIAIAFNMVQTEVAGLLQLEVIPMTREALVKIERGAQHIQASQLRAIKNALNVSCDELLEP